MRQAITDKQADEVQIPKAAIETLAKEWLAEATRIRLRAICGCDCDQPISVNGTRFKPGHDARLLKSYRQKIQKALAIPTD